MPIYRSLGSALVSEDEYLEKIGQGAFRSLADGGSVEFSTGVLHDGGFEVMNTEFVPIGLGKPLTIEIRTAYTGKNPRGFGAGKKDMLVTSAIRSITSYKGAPRAVNFLKSNVKQHTYYDYPAATADGTPVVFYSPALVDSDTILTLQMGFDEFPDEVFEQVGSVFGQAAAIPAFVAHSGYLLGAGAIVKFLGKLGSLIFDRPAVYEATEPLRFEYPGAEAPVAGYLLMTAEEFPHELRKAYQVGKNGRLQKDGQDYTGDIPYATLLLDGRERKAYKDFAPTHATAAMLDRFFKIGEGQSSPLDMVVDAMTLYNDLTFHKKAVEAQRELRDFPEGSPERARLQEAYKAYVKNIQNDQLKPVTG
jgi:hypothetical protein